MKLIFRYISSKNRLRILLCIALMLCEIALDMQAPQYSQKTAAAISNGTADMALIRSNGWAVFFLGLGGAIVSAVSCLFLSGMGASYGADLRAVVFKKINELDSESFNRIGVGSLLTRSNHDVSAAQVLLITLLQSGIQAPITAVWALIKIRAAAPSWTVAMAICIGALSLCIFVVTALVFYQTRRLRILQDAYNTATQQSMEGVRVLRAFRAEGFFYRRVESLNKALTHVSVRISARVNLLGPLVSLCRSTFTIVLYWLGALLMVRLSPSGRAVIMGNIAAFSQYSAQVISAFTSLVTVLILLPEIMISVRRLEEVIQMPQQLEYPDRLKVTRKTPGTIRLEHVSFAYQGAGDNCLSDLSLTIEAGETVAVTGRTGCGKTTLLQLMRRLLDPEQGTVYLGGNDIRNYTERQLSHIISVVPQKSAVFSGDIKSNICYGDNDYPDRLKMAVSAAQIDFLGEQGLHTPVSQNGVNLSGGQRQRLCLARALYHEADVYLLDDPFSALDVATEQKIHRELRSRYGRSTFVIVTQRLSTLRAADRVVLLHEGKLVDTGTHDRLMERCPMYRRLIDSQTDSEVTV